MCAIFDELGGTDWHPQEQRSPMRAFAVSFMGMMRGKHRKF